MKIFFPHPFGKLNKGDVAVLKSTLSSLAEKIPNQEITFYYKHSTIKRIWSGLIYSLKDYVKTDVVVFVTRDDLSLTYGFLRTFSILHGIFVAVVLRKPFMLYASQVGPFGNGLIGRMASSLTSFLLNRADLITVRDRISKRCLKRIGVTKPPIYVTADPAFLLRPVSPKRARMLLLEEGVQIITRKIIGINTSALIYRYGFYEANSVEEKRVLYVNLMSRVIDHIVENLGAMVILVPNVFKPQNDDRIIAREIYRKVMNKDKLNLITKEMEPEEIKGIIGLFDVFITTRYHPLVHSTSMHVPTIGIGYTFKMKGTMEELGCNNWLCHIKNINFEELISKIDELWIARKEVTKNLASRIKRIKKRSALNAELFQTFLASLQENRYEVRAT